MYRKFHTNNVVCLKLCHDQLCQMLRTGQAALIKIRVFCQNLKGYNLQFLEVMSLYYGVAAMRIGRYREDCHDLSNLQEQIVKKINLSQVYKFQICLYLKNNFSRALVIAVLILVGNLPHNIEVLTIWVSVGKMSSRHSSRREVGI